MKFKVLTNVGIFFEFLHNCQFLCLKKWNERTFNFDFLNILRIKEIISSSFFFFNLRFFQFLTRLVIPEPKNRWLYDTFLKLKNLTSDGLERAIWQFWTSFFNHYASFDEDPLCHWFFNFIFSGPSFPRKNMKREKARS